MKIWEIINEDVTAKDLEQIEDEVNELWDEDSVEFNLHRRGRESDGQSHFLHRANDPRNKPPIEPEEIETMLKNAHLSSNIRNKLKNIRQGQEVVITDPIGNVNMPVIGSSSKTKTVDAKIIPKTIMRKDNFLTHAEKIVTPTIAHRVKSAPVQKSGPEVKSVPKQEPKKNLSTRGDLEKLVAAKKR